MLMKTSLSRCFASAFAGIGLWLTMACVSGSTPTAASDASSTGDHLRFVEEADGSARLETVVVKMRGPADVHVDLVGAVHVADAAYFAALNERFRTYDAVLYELVGRPEPGKPLGNRAVANDPRLGWIGTLQQKMKEALRLEGQLESIDYSAPNFVHADMDLEAFQRIQGEKQETFLALWLKAMAAQQASTQSRPEGDLAGVLTLLRILMQRDSADELKRLIGREFDQVETVMSGLEAGGGTVIIGERNRVALEVLERELKAGKKKLAIFYGAGHFPDLQRRMEAMGFHRAGEEWLAAWSLPARVEPDDAASSKKGEAPCR
jgi:hypothetical protein